jgi:hypothetical protein
MSFVMGSSYEGDKTYEDGRQYADDDKLRVRFEIHAVKHEYESNQQGRPIFYDAEYIQIVTPGSRDVSTFPLDEHYKRRFAKAYAKWKAEGDQLKIQGTLLAELPWLTKSQIAELNYSNIQTVEQLAEMSDINAMKFMGNFQLRERAKNFLLAAAGEAPALKLQAELEQRDNHIQVLERKIEELTAAFERMDQKRK